MKTITVTEKNIAGFSAYQCTSKKLKLGEVLTVLNENIPSVRRENVYFAIVTDYEINDNTKHMISDERAKHVDAKKYGWDKGAESIKASLHDKSNSHYFNRYSINQKFIPKK